MLRRANAVLLLLVLVLQVFCTASPLQAAQGPTLVLTSPPPVSKLGKYLAYHRDPSGTMTVEQALERFARGEFATVDDGHFDGGYGTTPVWIIIKVESRVRADISAILATNIPFVPAIEMYWTKEGAAPQLIQRRTKSTPYIDAQFIGQSLVSNQFIIEAGIKGTLAVRMTPYGMGLLPLSLETPESIFARTATENIGFTAFYVFALSMLALFTVFNLALGSRGLFYFVFLFVAALLLIFQIDGFPQAWLWPGRPRWNLVASFPMLLTLDFASLLVAGYMLREGGFPKLGAWVQKISPIILMPLLAAVFFPPVWLITIGLVALPLCMALVFFAIFSWARNMRGQRYVAMFASIGMLIGVGIYMFYTLSGDADVADTNRRMLKVLYALGSVSIMASYATHAAALNRNYRTALQREVEAARRDAELSQSLLVSERNFNRARDLANLRTRQLAAAAHDLRQPVASLRLMMDSFARNAEPSVRSNLTRAFDYLDGLVKENLDAARPKNGPAAEELFFDEDEDSGNTEPAPANGANGEQERFSLGIVLQASAEIYREEAISKKIELRVVPSTLEVHANTIAVMRIVGNLVSNAVKHTERGRVLVGVRRGGERPRIIVADTGKGMSAEELVRFRTAYAKGENSAGEGLGLAICFELAANTWTAS